MHSEEMRELAKLTELGDLQAIREYLDWWGQGFPGLVAAAQRGRHDAYCQRQREAARAQSCLGGTTTESAA
jgi:hypothetical protein